MVALPLDAVKDLADHLTKYKLRAKATIKPDEDGWTVYAVDSSSTVLTDDCAAGADTRHAAIGGRALVRGSPDDIVKAHGLTLTSAAEQTCRAWAAGAPPSDAVRGIMPLEWGAQWLNGVAFEKGCYLGQEQVARTHWRGALRKSVIPVLIRAPNTPVEPAYLGTSLLARCCEPGDLLDLECKATEMPSIGAAVSPLHAARRTGRMLGVNLVDGKAVVAALTTGRDAEAFGTEAVCLGWALVRQEHMRARMLPGESWVSGEGKYARGPGIDLCVWQEDEGVEERRSSVRLIPVLPSWWVEHAGGEVKP